MSQHYIVNGIMLLTLLGGCTLGPKYTPPSIDLPCEWHSTIPCEIQEKETLAPFIWWESLNDPALNELIARAAHENLDVLIALSRVCQARRTYTGKKADLFPQVDGSLGYAHAYYNEKTLDKILSIEECKQHSSKKNIDIFELGFDARWEIDLFGKTARELAAFKADIEAAQEVVNDVWITLAAEIGKNYIELRGYQQQLSLLTRTIETQLDTVALTHSLYDAGWTNGITQSQSEEQLNLLEAKKPLIELAISKSIHRLSILVGENPAALFDELSCFSLVLPSLPTKTPIALPSELLRMRPDIRKAEREIAAATERVGSAIAGMFPRLSLRGFIGDITTHLPSLLNSSSGTWVAGPQLLLPIFNSRLIEQDIQFNKSKAKQALFQYQKVVLLALEETENSIAALNSEIERNNSLAHALNASRDVYLLTEDLYSKGLKDYFDVLTAERNVFHSEEAVIQSNVDLLTHYISLHKSLGR